MPLDFTFPVHLVTLFEKHFAMLFGLTGKKNNDVITCERSS